MPVEVEQVEDDVDDRVLLGAAADLRLPGQVHPLLEPLEARPPVGVERDDLAVEHGGAS